MWRQKSRAVRGIMILGWVAILLAAAVWGSGPAGKVVFSKQPISLQQPAGLTATFAAGDPIYGAFFFPASVKSLLEGSISTYATTERLEIKYYFDGNYTDNFHLTVKGDAFSMRTAFPLDVAPDPGRMVAYQDPNLEWGQFGQLKDGPMKWAKQLGALAPGAHKVRIEVLAGDMNRAVGEFTIQGGNYAGYAGLVQGIQGQAVKTVTMTRAKMNDKALESAMTQAMRRSSSDAWKGEILRVVIIDPEWYIERHPISGAILFRYIRAEVAVKTPAGTCCFYRLVTFKQDFASGRYGATRYDGHGDRVEIPCENVYK